MKVTSESEVAQSRPTLSDPMDCSLPSSSVHGIFQARVLEWGAIAWHTVRTQKRPFLQLCYRCRVTGSEVLSNLLKGTYLEKVS